MARSQTANTDYLVSSPYMIAVSAKVHDLLYHNSVSDVMTLIEQSQIIECLNKGHLFKNLTFDKFIYLTQKLKLRKYKENDQIISQGDIGKEFYVIKSGMVDISVNQKYVRSLNENESFGERALIMDDKRSATVAARTDAEIYSLNSEDFLSIIDSTLKDYLLNQLQLQDDKIVLEDLYFLEILGKGNFGEVSLVKCKKNNSTYALKRINKEIILNNRMHKHVELERNILLKIDHPFIVKMVKYMKDKNNIYFLMEYIAGLELFYVIRKLGLLNKYQAQFYTASILIAADYLHKRKIIYRDFKPENVLVKTQVSWIILGICENY